MAFGSGEVSLEGGAVAKRLRIVKYPVNGLQRPIVFHDLRNCFGSYLGMNNTNPKAMQELMAYVESK